MSDPINTVRVVSIDEERLKFRLTLAFIGHGALKGSYKFYLPPPTSFANSAHYNSCIISCGGVQASCNGVIADPVWRSAAGLHKTGAIELSLSIPSSQTTTMVSVVQALEGTGFTKTGGYRDLILLELKSVGDGVGANYVLGGTTAAWSGTSGNRPILCGNPFGQTITLTNHDPINDLPVWLTSAALGLLGGDEGEYLYSFDIEMVPNS